MHLEIWQRSFCFPALPRPTFQSFCTMKYVLILFKYRFPSYLSECLECLSFDCACQGHTFGRDSIWLRLLVKLFCSLDLKTALSTEEAEPLVGINNSFERVSFLNLLEAKYLDRRCDEDGSQPVQTESSLGFCMQRNQHKLCLACTKGSASVGHELSPCSWYSCSASLCLVNVLFICQEHYTSVLQPLTR